MGLGFMSWGVSPMQPSTGSAVPALSVVQISFLHSPVAPSALAAMLREKLEEKEEIDAHFQSSQIRSTERV